MAVHPRRGKQMVHPSGHLGTCCAAKSPPPPPPPKRALFQRERARFFPGRTATRLPSTARRNTAVSWTTQLSATRRGARATSHHTRLPTNSPSHRRLLTTSRRPPPSQRSTDSATPRSPLAASLPASKLRRGTPLCYHHPAPC